MPDGLIALVPHLHKLRAFEVHHGSATSPLEVSQFLEAAASVANQLRSIALVWTVMEPEILGLCLSRASTLENLQVAAPAIQSNWADVIADCLIRKDSAAAVW